MEARFDIDALDPDDPFEVDAVNLSHLFKHLARKGGRAVRIDLDDLRLLYAWGDVVYFPAPLDKGSAHWLMVAETDGVIVTVPLAPPKSGDPRRCRPIGLYEAAAAERKRYLEER